MQKDIFWSDDSSLPKTDIGKVEFLEHLAATLPKYQKVLQISDEEMESVKRDAIELRRAYNLKYKVKTKGAAARR